VPALGEELTKVLEQLVAEGLVKRRPATGRGSKGGRPSEEFRLATPEETEETSRRVA
jgi:predicted ArsR family transcriptional regulator